MTIAITGASGRIGNVLVRRLLEAGHDLRILSRRDSRALAGLPVQRVNGDLFDDAALRRCLDGCELAFHLAAIISISGDKSGAVQRVNVDGTRRVLDAALRQGLRRVVCFSSVHAFQEGSVEAMFDENRPLGWRSPMAYNRTKAAALDLALRFAAEHPLEVLALCPTGVLGPFDFEPSPAGRMLIRFYRRQIPLLVPGGFDWSDVRDVAEAALATLDRGRSGQAYLLPGHYATMAELSATIGRTTGRSTPKYVAPDWLLRTGVPFAAAFARLTGSEPLYTHDALNSLRDGSKYVSGEKAKQELGFLARPLESTLTDAYEWLGSNGYL